MELGILKDLIFYAKGLIDPTLCAEMIGQFDLDPRRHPGYTVNSLGIKEYESVKISTDLEVTAEGAWTPMHQALHDQVSQAVLSIAAQIPALQAWPLVWSGYKIQHYRQGQGEFKWHFDALGAGAWERQLAMIIYLNTVEEGGETCFLHQDLKIRPVAGDAVFFPTFWTHFHCGAIPVSSDKYVISSFVSFKIKS